MTSRKATSRIAASGGALFPLFNRCSHFPLFACLLLVCQANAAQAANITLVSDTTVATAGYYQLRWQADTAVDEFLIYESTSEDFSQASLLYRGADLATVISGKPDNDYYYRVKLPNTDDTSNTVKVSVKHHPLSIAFSFFAVGATVFLATLFLILSGNRKQP